MQEYQCARSTIYYDYQTKSRWQPQLQQLKDPKQILYTIINRYNQIYRDASFICRTTKNESAQIGALKLMMEANQKLYDAAVMPEIMNRLTAVEDMAAKDRR